MKVEARIFSAVAAAMALFATSYAIWQALADGTVEPIGVTALGMGGVLCGMLGLFFRLVAGRIGPRPEDRPEADIAEGAGDIGFFSPGSYWPIGLAAAAAVTGLGLAFWYVSLVVAGVTAVLLATGGLVFEYHTGTRRLEPRPAPASPKRRGLPGDGPDKGHLVERPPGARPSPADAADSTR